jgi:beta-glucosidase
MRRSAAGRRKPPAVIALLSAAAGPILFCSASAQVPPQLGGSPMEDVISAMTLEEKVRLLVGMGMGIDLPGVPAQDPADAATPEKVPGAAGRTHAIPRLGIPSLTLSDGPAGVRIAPVREGDAGRTYYATAFPVATLLASTWDTAVVRSVGAAIGDEAREYGVDILLAPAMNIHRNPLGGRNFEYYSEDPLVSGRIAAAFVDGVESEGVGTSIKHFVANNQEFNRMMLNTVVGERALREIYLKGFQIAVETAQPWTVMSSYNLLDGTYTSQSRELLRGVLRDEWGFDGFVMSDWFGGRDPVAQTNAGNDVLMPGTTSQTEAILAAVADGALAEAQLDENVAHVLSIVVRSPTFRHYAYKERPDLEGHALVARRAATEGMVLLKNDAGTLPLAGVHPVALFGNAGYQLIVGGSGSGDVNEAYSVSLARGLEAAGYALDAALGEGYASYLAEQEANRAAPQTLRAPPPIPEMPVEATRIQRAAGAADVAVVTLGRNSGEFEDRSTEADFDLTDTEHALLRDVARTFHAAGKKVVVVMNVAGVTEVASWRDGVDAILLAWQPGQEGGNAIADILSGKANPSGKLASTFPVAYADVPSAGTFPGKPLPGHEDDAPDAIFGIPSEVVYDEGIYVGYRYYDAFGVEPAYPFGYGLSYTDFGYGDLALSAASFEAEIRVTVTVTNVGPVAGREVVEVYVRAPDGGMDKPERELKAFAKTELLPPGGSQTLAFRLTAADLASFDADRGAWVAAAGRYTVDVGASSRDIRQGASFSLDRERTVRAAHVSLAPGASPNERKPARR